MGVGLHSKKIKGRYDQEITFHGQRRTRLSFFDTADLRAKTKADKEARPGCGPLGRA